MTLRAKFGWTIAAVSVIVNAGGAVYALLRAEWMHGGLHVALLAITVFLIALLRPGARRSADEIGDDRAEPRPVADARMEQLQQSVDAIAIEVERLGEAQRFNAKLAAKESTVPDERR